MAGAGAASIVMWLKFAGFGIRGGSDAYIFAPR